MRPLAQEDVIKDKAHWAKAAQAPAFHPTAEAGGLSRLKASIRNIYHSLSRVRLQQRRNDAHRRLPVLLPLHEL
jgi:hypothetical protein